MYRVYTCLTSQHDLRLVLLAGLICLFASWTALSLVRRGLADQQPARAAWIAAAAVVAGCGIWATHFVAMLALSTGLPTNYDLGLTFLSILVAVVGAGAGFFTATSTSGGRLWLAGMIVGASVGAMHFAGMAALQVPAFMLWDPWLVAASVLLGVAFNGLAIRLGLTGAGAIRMGLAALLMTVGICALHFTAMGAVHFEPTPLLPIPEQGLSSWWLALGVAGSVIVIIGSSMVGLIFDHHLARRVTREATRLRALVDATFEGIVIQADRIVVDLNENFAGLLGREREELIGQPILSLFAPEWAAQVEEHLDSKEVVESEAELLRADKTRVPVELLGRLTEYQGQTARVIAVRDVTERRAAAERIHHLAYHDALTELPNRVLLRQDIDRAVARVQRGGNLALLCLDLDRFKAVNDTLGHPVGDGLLKAVASRLQACVRGTDVVARLGGDEFAIIQEGASQPGDATALARRLVDSLSRPFDVAGHQIVIGTSIGVCLANDPGLDADGLLKCADLALYRAKAEGRGTWRFFEAGMDARMQMRRMMEMDLRQALPLEQLEVCYQPLVDVTENRITGFEALLRWHHPERGSVSPALFIPLAEEIGLIGQIGAWVLRQACNDAASWPADLKVAVNLSPIQFRDGALADNIAQILSDSGLSPARLELEVTESLLLKDSANVLVLLHKLRSLGVRFAMDDFGTGYSSLSYLRRFPFDKIKIDQSFITGVDQRDDSTAIVRAVIGLGRSLGMAVNAEGVETQDQLAALRSLGCGEVQGYLFSKALPAADIPELIRVHDDAWHSGHQTEKAVSG